MELVTLFLQADGSDDGFGWPLAIFLVGFFFCIALVLIAVITGFATSYRARMSLAREGAYRQLADDAVRANERTADRLERTVAELTELRQRTAELERMLKEVG
jgi:hypothetical protein